MTKLEKLQKFLDTYSPSVYWSSTYDGPEGSELEVLTNDWNQTLVTKINEIAARIYQDSGCGGPETILISGEISDLQGLFHTLLYFKPEFIHYRKYFHMGILSGRYNVIVIPGLNYDNKIFVCKLADKTLDPFVLENYMKVGVIQIKDNKKIN